MSAPARSERVATERDPVCHMDVEPAMAAAQSTYQDNYAPSESAPFTVSVARTIGHPSSGFVIKGKIKPDFANKKVFIKVSKKAKKGFKKYKTIKTNSSGKYKITLPKRRGTWYWSFSIKGDSQYLGNGFVWRTWVS